eukprot:s2573_g4.t1
MTECILEGWDSAKKLESDADSGVSPHLVLDHLKKQLQQKKLDVVQLELRISWAALLQQAGLVAIAPKLVEQALQHSRIGTHQVHAGQVQQVVVVQVHFQFEDAMSFSTFNLK